MGTHRQLVTVFSSPKAEGGSAGNLESNAAALEQKACRFSDNLLHAMIQSYRLNLHLESTM